jgi:hypothetical protein
MISDLEASMEKLLLRNGFSIKGNISISTILTCTALVWKYAANIFCKILRGKQYEV